MKRFPAFKAGTHTASNGTQQTFSAADVAEIAASFNDAVHSAPLVIGHPAANHPAYGWVDSLDAADGTLYVTPRDMHADFADAVKSKRYTKVSISVWDRNHPSNPNPGKLSLRHVGFLGAVPPSVKGFPDVEFASDDNVCVYEFAADEFQQTRWTFGQFLRGFRDWLLVKDKDAADAVVPPYFIESVQAEHAVAAAAEMDSKLRNFAELESQADALKLRIAALDAELAQKRADEDARQKSNSINEFCEALIESGKVLPREIEIVRHLSRQLIDGQPLSFSEGELSSIDALKELVQRLPAQVNFSEVSAPAGDVSPTLDFALPEGAYVNEQKVVALNKAKQLMAADSSLTLFAALQKVGV